MYLWWGFLEMASVKSMVHEVSTFLFSIGPENLFVDTNVCVVLTASISTHTNKQ